MVVENKVIENVTNIGTPTNVKQKGNNNNHKLTYAEVVKSKS